MAIVMSIQTRQVHGYCLRYRMLDDLVVHALLNVSMSTSGHRGFLFNCDCGSWYASHDFRRTLTIMGFMPRLSRKGNCWDSTVEESCLATLENAEVAGTYPTRAGAHAGIANFIHASSNPNRPHSTLGNLSQDSSVRTFTAASWGTSYGERFKLRFSDSSVSIAPNGPGRGGTSTSGQVLGAK